MTSLHADVAPPDFLQLAGHPIRWRLLAALVRGDHLVTELTGLVGEPQNLVSYHLAKLRDARLVSARQSSADRRDAYYSVDLAGIGVLLAAAAEALHPGLGPAPAPRMTRNRARILFLCTGNSARSQMAEALVNAWSNGAVQASSAGSDPKPLHPHAIRAMRELHGLDLSGAQSKHLDTFAKRRFNIVISLCDRVREVCPDFPHRPETIHWSIANPADAAGRAAYAKYKQTAAELATRVKFLLADLGARKDKP